MILAAASITYPSYVPTNWQTFLLTALIMIIHAMVGSMPTKWIANFNSVGTVINIICLVITIIIIPAACISDPKFRSNGFAWGIQNFTEFPDGIAVMMSFLAIIWTMSGYGERTYITYHVLMLLDYSLLTTTQKTHLSTWRKNVPILPSQHRVQSS